MNKHHPLLSLFLASLALALQPSAKGKELNGTYLPTTNECPSPEEARAKMTVPEGYAVRCFAHEPMVQNPVAMTWDHRGRLWVVEAYEYPNGSPHPAPFGNEAKDDQYHPVPPQCLPTKNEEPGTKNLPRDRVIILEDTNNDGEADKRTVFVEGLNLASAILCGDDGIYIGQQPHLIHFRDENGDDKPDAWRVVLTGFGRQDTHELVNSFTWGPDGWLYMTHGVFTNSKVRRPGQPENEGFKFDAGIGRARPVKVAEPPGQSAPAQLTKSDATPPAWEFEVFADGTSNPWGCDYDAAGNFFISACVIDHFFHMAPGGIYVRQGGAPENPYCYEQLPSIVKHKHFRAAYAGVQIYQGGRYPKDTWGHAFIGNIHDNAVHEEVITPVGAGFKCEPRRDFLRANDGWFRPVSTQTGPDGNLWVMDWCDKYPCYQNAKANPEGVDRDRGRIWRVVYTGRVAEKASAVVTEFDGLPEITLPPSNVDQPIFKTRGLEGSRLDTYLDIKKLSTEALVELFEDSNNWLRRMARRILVERKDAEKSARLESLVKSDEVPFARMEALWAIGQLDHDGKVASTLDYAASHKSAPFRLWAARWVGEHAADTLFKEGMSIGVPGFLERLAGDKDPAVRLATAIALRQFSARRLTVDGRGKDQMRLAWPEMFTALMKAGSTEKDHMLSFSTWQAIEPMLVANPTFWLDWLAETAPETQPFSQSIVHKAMHRLSDTQNAKHVDRAFAFCEGLTAQDALLATALEGLIKGQEGSITKPVRNVSAALTGWRKHHDPAISAHARTLAVLWGDEAAVQELLIGLKDTQKSEKDRIAILQSLRQVRTDSVKNAVSSLLNDNEPGTLTVTAIRMAADIGGDDFIPALLRLAASKDFQIRYAAIEALAGRDTWTDAMLDAIAEGQISASGFPAPVRRQLATSKDKATRDHAFKVLGAWQDSSEDIKTLIAQKKQACLTGEPDLANGKLFFTATCMVCHEFHGGGQKVGPDLIGSGRSNLDALLANVIDPNQIIGNGYENFTLATKDGRTLSGRVVEDTPGHVKLLGPGGASQIVSRAEISTLTNSKQSLMPMGFGNLPDTAFRDMIWYILAPPDEGPLTKEKKELLIRGVELAEPATAKPQKTNWRAIDWESVSHWNPDWKVNAPDFERTPVKLAEYHGQTNVLLMHPFTDKKTPASLEHKLKVTKTKLKFRVASDDRGDWLLKVMINDKEIKEQTIDSQKPRWKDIEIDLTPYSGQEITLKLEAHPNGWAWEFAYWQGITFE
ncbi:MAG: PVC-type heme-binding CxxCH protein [Verrucomicrobiota bacterium]